MGEWQFNGASWSIMIGPICLQLENVNGMLWRADWRLGQIGKWHRVNTYPAGDPPKKESLQDLAKVLRELADLADGGQ